MQKDIQHGNGLSPKLFSALVEQVMRNAENIENRVIKIYTGHLSLYDLLVIYYF